MNEKYFAPIPDIKAYAKRLGMEDRYVGDGQYPLGEPTRELLDELVYAHQTHIPFDALDSYDLHRPVSLVVEDLFNKIILNRRGGFCFELNSLFGLFLRDIGYAVMPVFARIMYRHEDEWPVQHRGNVITIGQERFYCDVGCGGPMAACAIPLIDDAKVASRGQVYGARALEHNWWCIDFYHDGTKPGEPTVTFIDAPANSVDMVALAYYCSAAPDSVFCWKRLCNLRTPNGEYALADMELTINEAGKKEIRTIENNEELLRVLSDYFTIESPELTEALLNK